MKTATSCLFEDDDKNGNQLSRRIDSLISIKKEKLKLLTQSLNRKIVAFEKRDNDVSRPYAY